MFLGESQETNNTSTTATVKADMLSVNNEDIKLIIAKITGTMGGNAKLADKELLVLTNDALEMERYKSADFTEELKRQLANSIGDSFCKIRTGGTDGYPEASKLKDGFYIVIRKVNSANEAMVGKAVLQALEGSGSLTQPEIVLEGEGKYNIGVGKRTRLDNGRLRTNHIAISDNQDDPQYENNKYISRDHAHITYTSEEGWRLHVELNGTRMRNKRTRILRNGEIIDMLNPVMPQKLMDGDIIELSKCVLLSFNIKQ